MSRGKTDGATNVNLFEEVGLPAALQTTDTDSPVVVINLDPDFEPFTSDRFGLQCLLGRLSGARSFGEQNKPKREARREFDEAFSQATTPEALRRGLGRVGFLSLVETDDGHQSAVDLVRRIMASDVASESLVVICGTEAQADFAKLAAEELMQPVYVASFKRIFDNNARTGARWSVTSASVES